MRATREQLLARWETPEGLQLAEQVRQALNEPGSRRRGLPQGGIRPLDPSLVSRLARLPFADEVSAQIDLRGFHIQTTRLNLKYTDLSNVRLDSAYEIRCIINCQTAGAILDGCHSINGIFSGQALNGISLVGASLNGGMFEDANMSEANLQGAHLVVADFSRANCTQASFPGADLRFANAHDANVSGADLREADLTEANLGGVLFDSRTRLQGANLWGALLSPDFRTFAQQAGAQLTPRQTHVAKQQVELNATIKALQEKNADGHLDEAIALLSAERNQAPDPLDPDYVVQHALDERFDRAGSPAWVEEVWETWYETEKALAYYV
ncbi:MAG: pentapeptide repeat-containing protein [Ktedonobacteraceae bacterium]|nr:pentapeptide repeat-containing protein [Ktedonobacteraceae bacterium]